MIKWLRGLRARVYIRSLVGRADNINAKDTASMFGIDVDIVHKICAQYVNKGQLQRLYNTPSIDYHPIGLYGGVLILSLADGAKSPFLDDNGNLKAGLVPPSSKRPDAPHGGNLFEWNDVNAWTEVAPLLGGQATINSLAVYSGRIYGDTSTASFKPHCIRYPDHEVYAKMNEARYWNDRIEAFNRGEISE